jgi:hypothetical protein
MNSKGNYEPSGNLNLFCKSKYHQGNFNHSIFHLTINSTKISIIIFVTLIMCFKSDAIYLR